MGYPITQKYIKHGNARPGSSINGPRFLVAHDTGNPGSTAHGNRKYFNDQQPSASAHTFIDDQYILEIIPLTEKAYHVQYQKREDNRRFGYNSNDAALGVELCYGGSIDFKEAYARYVWYFAYLCNKYGFQPEKHIAGHFELDPGRKTDPENALEQNGVSFRQFIKDVRQTMGGEVKAMSYDAGLIRKGDKGQDVKTLQEKLAAALGIDIAIDGIFGPETEKAVKQLQKKAGISIDGIAGPETREAIKELMEPGEMIMDPDSPTLRDFVDDWLQTAIDRGLIEEKWIKEYRNKRLSISNALALKILIDEQQK